MNLINSNLNLLFFSLPWQRKRQFSSSSSGFIIEGRRILTNAHCVADHTQVKVKRRGSDVKYMAQVLAVSERPILPGIGLTVVCAHHAQLHLTCTLSRSCATFLPLALLFQVAPEGDMALLTVEDEAFWEGSEPVQFGSLPQLQDAVAVVG